MAPALDVQAAEPPDPGSATGAAGDVGGNLAGLSGARGRRLLEASAQLASVEGRDVNGNGNGNGKDAEALRKERGESLDLWQDLEHAYRGVSPHSGADLRSEDPLEDPLTPRADGSTDDLGVRPGSDPTHPGAVGAGVPAAGLGAG